MSNYYLNYTEIFYCTESAQTYEVKFNGVYTIEVSGAQGGGSQSSGNTASGVGGRGGYASGKVNLEKGTTLYVYVGCVGGSSYTGVAYGGYNGGGAACSNSQGDPANGGGGASDVRLIGGSWDNSNGLLSRFIVAGGGGGGSEDSSAAGYGGGITGGQGYFSGTGGVFGKGANTPYEGGGGGGGWIGGGTPGGSQTIPTSCSGNEAEGGSGGSGYVYTNTSEVYNGYLVPTKYQMFDAVLIGDRNEGNGYVIITIKIKRDELRQDCTNYNRVSFLTSFVLTSLTGIFIFK